MQLSRQSVCLYISPRLVTNIINQFYTWNICWHCPVNCACIIHDFYSYFVVFTFWFSFGRLKQEKETSAYYLLHITNDYRHHFLNDVDFWSLSKDSMPILPEQSSTDHVSMDFNQKGLKIEEASSTLILNFIWIYLSSYLYQ